MHVVRPVTDLNINTIFTKKKGKFDE